MYGTTLSNAQVESLLGLGTANGGLSISEFRRENLKLSHYRLRPGMLYRPTLQQPDGDWDRVPIHDFSGLRPFKFEAGEYLIVAPIEHIELPDGMVAQVIPASTLVEQCFSLTSGKLDANYSQTGAKFIMGIKNLRDEPNMFHPSRGIANVSFVDFRGAKRNDVRLTSKERRDYADRPTVD